MDGSSGTQHNHDDDRARRLFALAYHYARRVPLTHEEAEDCAEFVLEQMYEKCRLRLAPPEDVAYPDAWLRCCVHRLVIRYLRHLASELSHVARPSFGDNDDPAEVTPDLAAAGRTPEEQAIHDETWRQIIVAVDRLSLTQHLDFIQCNICGETPDEIARITRRTRVAVYHSLDKARRRLRVLLEEQGLTEAELRSAFTPPSDLAELPPARTALKLAEK